MKYLLLTTLISCKVTMTEPKDSIPYVENTAVFEGRYYFQNGGMIEMYTDHNNQVSTISSTLIFSNTNNTLATLTFPALSKLEKHNNEVTSSLLTMTGTQANSFVGNIQGNASNGVQLSSTGTFRYKVTLKITNNALKVTLEIHQLVSGLYSIVYKNTVSEL